MCVCIYIHIYGTTWDHIGSNYDRAGKISEEHCDIPTIKVQRKDEEPPKEAEVKVRENRRLDCPKNNLKRKCIKEKMITNVYRCCIEDLEPTIRLDRIDVYPVTMLRSFPGG